MTPLLDKLRKIKRHRYHIPGHKGNKIIDNLYEIDFTETNDTGNLYLADGIIFESEQYYKDYFGAFECIYMTGGSTQGIKTAIFDAKPKKLLCDRNSHKALCHALAFVDCEYSFINPSIFESYQLSAQINPQAVENALQNDREIDCLYITSPNYYGIHSDIKTISQICNKYNIKLIVDEAHGCHLPSIGINSAVQNGADYAITSAHKTTDSLGQGAILTTKNQTNARKNSAIFGTSSPSYAIMASIEVGLKNVSKYNDILSDVLSLREKINANTNFRVVENNDPFRLVVNTRNTNLSGYELFDILENDYDIVAEMCDLQNVVFIISYHDDLDYLYNSFMKIPNVYKKLQFEPFKFIEPSRTLSIRQALFSDGEIIDLENALGRISKNIVCPYPPGVPLIYPGEIILQEHIEYIRKMCYNISKLEVVRT